MNEVRSVPLNEMSVTDPVLGEYAPVMVDLDEEGREIGLIRL